MILINGDGRAMASDGSSGHQVVSNFQFLCTTYNHCVMLSA